MGTGLLQGVRRRVEREKGKGSVEVKIAGGGDGRVGVREEEGVRKERT